jgi:hypothetical protein
MLASLGAVAVGTTASATEKPLFEVVDSIDIGDGEIIDIMPQSDRWIVVDNDCADGCFHVISTAGKKLEKQSGGDDLGAKKLVAVAPARHVENGYLWSDGERIGVVQVGDSVKKVGTYDIAGVTGFVGLARGAYLATSDAVHFARFTDGEAKVLLSKKAKDRNFVDSLTGEPVATKFSPVWLDTDGKELFIGMADGSVWQTDIRIQDGLKFRAGFKPGHDVRQLLFGAYGPLVSTAEGFAPARARGTKLFKPKGGGAPVDVHAVNDGWAVFVVDSKLGVGIAQISSKSDDAGTITYSFDWTLAGPKGARHVVGFKNEALGLGAVTAKAGEVSLLVKPDA